MQELTTTMTTTSTPATFARLDGAPLSWERALAAWLTHLRSERTRATYAASVRAFWTVEGMPQTLDALTVEHLDAYAGALALRAEAVTEQAARLAPATVNLRLAALRSFLAFCRRRKWLAPDLTAEAIADALTGVRASVQRPYQVLDADELEALRYAASEDPWQAARAVALAVLAWGSGLRVAELVALNVGDILQDRGGAFLDVRSGKGRKQRQVPISEDVLALMVKYLRATGRELHRAADRGAPLFVSTPAAIRRTADRRLSVRHAQRIITEAAKRAGFDNVGKHISPHALRHSYALRVLSGDPTTGQEPAPLPAVSKLLGHSGVAVTGRYVNHFERADLQRYAPRLRSEVDGVAGHAGDC